MVTREDSDAHSQRLSTLHTELGDGEGVTQLVRASLNDLSGGGTGVLSPDAPLKPSAVESCDAAECFRATVDFFDRLCTSSATLAPKPMPRRQSVLRQRLEAINVKLHKPELASKVRSHFSCVGVFWLHMGRVGGAEFNSEGSNLCAKRCISTVLRASSSKLGCQAWIPHLQG
jgi:hypothetical protein